MGLLLLDLPVGVSPIIFLADLATLEQAGEVAGYPVENLEIPDGSPTRFYTVDVDDLPGGQYLVISDDPAGSGYVDTRLGSGPWPVVDGIFSRLNVAWIGGLPVLVGDVRANLVSQVSRLCGKLPIFVGEDHLSAESRELVVDGIEDELTGATGKLTIKDESGEVVVDHLSSSNVDNVAKRIKFPLTAAQSALFDLEKRYFFFAQAVFANGHKITVKRGEVELFDTAETEVPL